MKIGIIGAGLIVPDFLKALSEVSESKPLTIQAISGTDTDVENMKKLQKEFNIKNVHTDTEALLNDDIDVVYVAVPNHLHYSIAKEALLHKKHVILEKPFTSTYKQAKELMELSQQLKVMIFEAISNQYLPNYDKVKSLLPELGDVKIVELNYSQYSRRYDLFKTGQTLPVFDPKKSGGAIMDLNVYNIHFIIGLFGAPQKAHYIANIEKGIDTSGILTLEYETFKAVAIAAKDSKGSTKIAIQGDKGCIQSDQPANVFGTFTLALNDGKYEEHALNDGKHRLFYEANHFIEMIEQKDFEAAKKENAHTLKVAEVLDAARLEVGIEI